MTLRLTVVVVALAALSSADVSAQRNRTQDLLARAAAYLEQFVDRFGNVVAEERYVQDSKTFPLSRRPRGAPRSAVPPGGLPRHIELTSDFLLVQSPDKRWVYAFRDVFAVNGEPVRDRDERLTQLFLQPLDVAVDRAQKIAAEGARFNLAGPGRTVNSPLLAMGFLQAYYQPRFRFSERGTDAELGRDVWILEFKEETRPTLLRLEPDADLPVKGRVWVEGQTGRVVKTELVLSELDTIVTTFRFDDRLQIAVPHQMREDFWMGNEVVAGAATYDKFRQFNVRTEEQFQPPPDAPRN
jgi:hypothetical protein